MKYLFSICTLFGTLAAFPDHATADDATDLLGVWVAQSMEANGKPASPLAVKRMQFTFKGDKLFVRGNFRDDREEESTYKIDPAQNPKHFEFQPPSAQKPVLGIYELKDNSLKICVRHARSESGRPTEFATAPDSDLVLIEFRKQ